MTYSPVADEMIFSTDVGSNERAQLFLLSGDGRDIRQLTNAPQAIHSFGGWSHDGRRIAYASNARDARVFDIYVMDVRSGKADMVFQGHGWLYVVGFSPDDGQLLMGKAYSIEQDIADPKRIAVYGGSYGGFMVLAALTQYPELWAAGIDMVGIANFITFLQNTGPWRRHLRIAEYGDPEKDRDLLERISPIKHVHRLKVPLMVVHGANDPRVPVSEAEQIVAALRARHVPVVYLRYEDEGHGLSKLANRLDAYAKMADFLDQICSYKGTEASRKGVLACAT